MFWTPFPAYLQIKKQIWGKEATLLRWGRFSFSQNGEKHAILGEGGRGEMVFPPEAGGGINYLPLPASLSHPAFYPQPPSLSEAEKLARKQVTEDHKIEVLPKT